VGFVVDKVALRFFSEFFGFTQSISPSLSNSYHLQDEQYVRPWQQFRDAVSPHKKVIPSLNSLENNQNAQANRF
jgi:hypothetical protein